MNNNDFYGNLDRIRKLYLKQSYDEAVKIADKIDFKRLKDWKYIAMLINLYEAVGRLEDVRYFCILAYNRNLGGKKLLYKLTKVMIRLEEIDEAEELYEEYLQIAARDNKKYELLYELKAVQGAKKTELIKILEDYMKRDLDEKYAYTLAELYAKTKQNEKCINFCTKIMERFESGEAAEKAAALKNSIMNTPATAQTAAMKNGAAQPSAVPPMEKAAGQNTIGLNVEQILAEAGGDTLYSAGMGNTTQGISIHNLYTTQNIPIQQNMYGTQGIPTMQDIYGTQGIPVSQGMYGTQGIPTMQDMYGTQGIPVSQDMYGTQGISVPQDMYGTQGIPAMQGTQGISVPQDMQGTQGIPVSQDMQVTQGIPVPQNMQGTQGISVPQDMQGTQGIPVPQDMQATQGIPVSQDMQATQVISVPQDMQATQVISVPQDMQITQDIPAQPEEIQKTEEIPTIEEQPIVPLDEEDIASLEANKLRAQEEQTAKEAADETETNVAGNQSVQAADAGVEESSEAAVEAAKNVEEVTAAKIVAEEAVKEETVPVMISDMTAPLGSTMRVDTEAVNAAIAEAAVTKDTISIAGLDGTQDIESTMAMVEAALADETRAAQFDARMDMPEYSDEYTAPVKEKITLRAFQPEIDKVYEIPMEVKRYFTKYNYVSGLEAQIGEYFESTKHEDKMGTSGIGNIIISGNRSSDKTTLAINIVKALNTLYSDNVRKIARTNGDNINQRGIERSIGKLLGSALIIEEAGVIDRQRVLELIEVMESDTQEMLIILEDSESEINELLKNNPELIEKFNHRLTYKQFTVNELVEMCKRYADKCQYTIDEKALLQLYLRIDEIHSNSDGVSLEDVRDVIDTAIEYADKRASKKIFGGAKKKKIGDKEYTVLVESDFKE